MNIDKKELTLSELKTLNAAVEKRYGYDFKNYAMTSFKRRVARFMSLEKILDLNELVHKVIENDKVYNRFLKEITVNTTEMFRFPPMWKKLRDEVFPALKYKNHIRIWHVGCSTGEEVYSMAITLKELDLSSKVSLVATDVNDDVLEVAKTGIYSSRNLKTHQENYMNSGGTEELSQYFKISGSGMNFKMNDDLIDNVKFYKHNLILDGEFGKFDLILCRNVLIYFDKILQEQVFQVMLNSLNSLGFLVLGSKESMIWSSTSDKYKVISDKSKIFRIKETNVV